MIAVPNCEFAEYGHNLQATPSPTAPGTSITTGTVAHTKTAYASLIDPIPGDCYGFWLQWGGTGLAATVTRALLDLALSESGVGAADSGIILPNYLIGSANGAQSSPGLSNMIYVPIFLPAGKRLSARWQSARAAAVAGFFSVGLPRCSPSGVPPKVWSKADAIGVTEASSSGTAITAGSSGAESAWTSIGGTTSRDYEAFLPGVQMAADNTLTSSACHVEFGAGSTAWAERWFQVTSAEMLSGLFPPDAIYHGAPAGTQMQARIESSGTGESLDYALYGLY